MKTLTGSLLCLYFVSYAAAFFVRRGSLRDNELVKISEVQSHMLSLRMMARDLEEAEMAEPNLPNIPGKAKELGLSTLVQYVVEAKLADTLSSPGPFTVFGPTNAAFDALPDAIKAALAANVTLLAEVLTYHVLPRNVLSTDLSNELLVDTVQGSKLRINIYKEANKVTAQCSPITQVDQMASNGVIHVLSKVMFIPPGNIVESVVAEGSFTTLVTAVQTASLEGALSAPGPLTLFAPTDAAFAKIPPATLEKLLKNLTLLTSVLKYHVVSQTYCSAGLTSTSLTTLNGEDIKIVTGPGGVTVNGAKVVSADLSVTNGVVHAIDTVLIPPSVDLSTL